MEKSLEEFLSWACENKVFIDDRVEFKWNKNNGISAKVNENIPESSELFRIPKHLVIGPNLFPEVFPNINEKEYVNENSLSKNEMTILLVSKLAFDDECSKKFFRPYFNILPKKLNLPYFWNPQEIELLQNTDAGVILERNFRKLVSEWVILIEYLLTTDNLIIHEKQILKELTFFKAQLDEVFCLNKIYLFLGKESSYWASFKNYLWSYSITTSRGFPYILTSSEKTKEKLRKVILVPVLDLLNHKNNTKVTWKNASDEDSNIAFQINENVNKYDELFNNYGDKSNLELMLNYGFIIENNSFDETTISLQINDKKMIEESLALGIRFFDEYEEVYDVDQLLNGINFKISSRDPLPSNLINFFAYLVQLKFEHSDGITLRMVFEGLVELQKILVAKISSLQTKPCDRVVSSVVMKIIQDYKNGQKKLFHGSLETLQQYEKKLIKDFKVYLTSFKTIMKNDKQFMAFLSQHFGVRNYEDILKKNILDDVIALWVIRVSSSSSLPKNEYLENSVIKKAIDFVMIQFSDIRSSIEITKDDIDDAQNVFDSYFPLIAKKFDIFSLGCKISDFIIAQTVMDRVSYIRNCNQELFIVQKVKFV